MRLKIHLKSDNSLFIPFNYNHIVTSMIYKKIADLELAKDLHSSNSFKFFTFSQLNIPQRKRTKEGLISKNGVMNFQISSPNDYLIKNLVQGYLNDLEVNFKGQQLFVEKVELLKTPEIKDKINVKTLSPIIARTKKEIDGKLKVWDLNPGDQLFFTNLKKNLIKKYEIFNNAEVKEDSVNISSEMSYVKRKRIAIKKGEIENYHRAFMMDLTIEGDSNILKFGYDCGIGEKNSMGFGMIK
jgi:CRISPR-associated endoribonuclease Cas6